MSRYSTARLRAGASLLAIAASVALSSPAMADNGVLDAYSGDPVDTGTASKSYEGGLIGDINTYTNEISAPGSVTFLSSYTLANQGTLNNDGGSTLINNGTLTNQDNAMLNNIGTMTNSGVLANRDDATLSNSGTLVIVNGGALTNEDNAILTDSGTLTINIGGTLTNQNAATLTVTFTGRLSDEGVLTNEAGGTLTNAGTLTTDIGATLTNNGTLNNNSGALLTNNGTLGNAGTLNDNSGGMLINNGTLTNETGGTLNLNGASTLTNNGTMNNDASATLTVSMDSALENASGGTLTNTGTLTNLGELTNFGTLDNEGTLNIGNGGANAELSGNVTNNGTLTFNHADLSSYSGVISGTGTVTQMGSGTITLTGANTYTGGTNISSGTLALEGSGSLAPTGAVSVASGATFDISGLTNAGTTVGDLSGAGIIALGANNLTAGSANSTTYSGVISGSGGTFTKQGTGTLTLTGTNTYSGGTTLEAGTLIVGNNNALGTGGVTVAGNADLGTTNGDFTLANAMDIASGMKLTVDTNAGNTLTLSGVLSDAGGLTESGSGTLILSAANTYSGGTRINTGATLALVGVSSLPSVNIQGGTFDISGIAASGITLSAIGGGGLNDQTSVINLGSKSLTTSGTNTPGAIVYYFGAINDGGLYGGSGGSFTLAAGSLGLGQPNTYTGTTTINSGATLGFYDQGSVSASSDVIDNGTLDVSISGSASIKTLSGSGIVALGANTLTVTDGSTSFTGIIQDGGFEGGTGGQLAITGGTETLTGANTYTGGTIVNGGTLQIAGAGTLGATSGSVAVNGGTLDLGGTTQIQTGGVTITGGTIQNGTLSSSGTFNLQGGTVSAVLAGTGAATISVGTVTLTNTNTYSGGTMVDAGATLLLTPGASVAGTITDNGLFGFDESSTLILTSANTGNLGGTGGLAVTGGGTLIVDTQLDLTGTSNVTNGILQVGDINTPTASLAGGVNVGSGGTLEGHGTINGAVTVASGGTLRPGGSIGTLTVNEPVTLASGSTFVEEYSSSAASKLAASGAVSLGGTLQLSPDSTSYTNNTTYQFISGSSVMGTFASVSGANSPYTIQYSATGVDLILDPVTVTTPPQTTFLFGTYGGTANQIAVGNAIAAGASTGALYTNLGHVVSSNTAALPATLAQLSGDIHASIASAMVQDGKIIRDTVINHAISSSDTITVWGTGFAAYGFMEGNGDAADVHHNDAGVMIGADMPIMANVNVGLGIALTDQAINAPSELAAASGSTNHVVGYANWSDDAFVASLGWDYGWGSNQVVRQIGAFSETDTDHQSNRLGQVFGEVGYRIPADQFDVMALEPYLDIANVIARTGAFNETGGLGALDGGADAHSENFSTLGMRATLPNLSLMGVTMTPDFNLGWSHAFTRFMPNQALAFAGTGESFLVSGMPLDSDAAAIQAGLNFILAPDATLDIGYDGNVSAHVQDHAVRGQISWRF